METYEPRLGVAERRKARHRAVPLLPEVRHFRAEGLEVRSRADTDEIIVVGYPIVYDTPYAVTDMFGEFQEEMRAGVADDVLASNADVRFLFNHDGLPLARSAAGTMLLQPEATRFGIEAHLDARQQIANDLAIAIERGDITQMSCGFIVARDEWDDAMENRVIFSLAELLDVSPVTYPASPTTSIQVAHRMALAMPVESRARVRKLYADVRAGKVLSQDNQDKLIEAAKTLHSVLGTAGVDPGDIVGDESHENADANGSGSQVDPAHQDDGTETGGNLGSDGQSPTYTDGTGARSQPPASANERRAQSMSFGDQQSAVYQALLAKFGDGDGDSDLWICDLGTDWVVYEDYLEPMGTFRVAYSLDADNEVTIAGDPQRVAQQTSYVPVDEPDDDVDDDADATVSASPAAGMRTSTLRLLADASRSRRPNVG